MMTPVNAGDLVLTISIETISIAPQARLGELKNQGGSLASHSVGWVLSNQEPGEMKDSFIEVLNLSIGVEDLINRNLEPSR